MLFFLIKYNKPRVTVAISDLQSTNYRKNYRAGIVTNPIFSIFSCNCSCLKQLPTNNDLISHVGLIVDVSANTCTEMSVSYCRAASLPVQTMPGIWLFHNDEPPSLLFLAQTASLLCLVSRRDDDKRKPPIPHTQVRYAHDLQTKVDKRLPAACIRK